MAWRIERDSFTKCVVWFKDGNTRTFYSIDWVHRYSSYRDRELGLAGLRSRIVTRYAPQSGFSIIYDAATNQELEKYYEGTRQTD